MTFFEEAGCGRRTNHLDFGDDPDLATSGSSDPSQDSDPGILMDFNEIFGGEASPKE